MGLVGSVHLSNALVSPVVMEGNVGLLVPSIKEYKRDSVGSLILEKIRLA